VLLINTPSKERFYIVKKRKRPGSRKLKTGNVIIKALFVSFQLVRIVFRKRGVFEKE
jgi:hypothetical protein